MGLFDGISRAFNPLNVVVDAVNAVAKGDFKQLFSTVSQLALTFATGGMGALAGPLLNALQSFGSQLLSGALAGNIVSKIGQEFIQMMGEKMNLPQSAIDAAQAAFCESCGDKAGARANYREAGHLGEGNFWDRNTVSGKERADSKQFLAAILGFAQNTPAGRGIADRTAEGLQNSIVDSMMDLWNSMFEKEVEKKADELKKGGKDKEVAGGEGRDVAGSLGIDTSSFLMKFALLLGKTIDNKTDDMMKLAREMNQKSESISDIQAPEDKDDVKGNSEFQKQLAQTNSELGQMSSMLNALGKEIQTLQEALKSSLDAIGQAQAGLARKN